MGSGGSALALRTLGTCLQLPSDPHPGALAAVTWHHFRSQTAKTSLTHSAYFEDFPSGPQGGVLIDEHPFSIAAFLCLAFTCKLDSRKDSTAYK